MKVTTNTLSIAILFILVLSTHPQTCSVANYLKTDCGKVGLTQSQCESSGCCWSPANELTSDTTQNVQGNIPWCFYPLGGCSSIRYRWTKGMGFDSSFYSLMYGNFMANLDIDGKGGVVAAPDYNTPGGSYYFNWMRDAALSMRTFMELNNFNLSIIQPHMNAYASWVKNVQNEANPAGFPDIRINPKFDLPNGEVYSGPWCRPQTDGPGLRSATLQIYANTLIQNGQTTYVTSNLVPLIKDDLNWVLSSWQSSGCDLWEEITSDDFFWNRAAFVYTLGLCQKLFSTLGDSSYATQCSSVQSKIKQTLENHWTGEYMYESTNRMKDGATVHAFSSFEVYPITSFKLAKTMKVLSSAFCDQYLINQIQTNNGLTGILIGRYPGDVYAGGNPWQLLTAVYAKVFYQVGNSLLNSNGFTNIQDQLAWLDLLGISSASSVAITAKAALQAGDAVMYRMYENVKINKGHIYQQMSKTNGTQMSASDLTWSYANIMSSMKERQKLALNLGVSTQTY